MSKPIIRKAQPHEAEAISQLGIRSKAYWGYSAEQMQVFESELTISPETIVLHPTIALELDGRLIGYYALLPKDSETVELEHLFIDPSHLRQGFGGQLLQHSLKNALSLGFSRMMIQSDPNAEQFYLAHGATRIELIASSIPGRTIPLLTIALK